MKKNIIVTHEVLELYDKYDGDLGLIDERWADEDDQNKITLEQTELLAEYLEKLNLLTIRAYSEKMKIEARERALELEKFIDCDVVTILKKRVQEGEML